MSEPPGLRRLQETPGAPLAEPARAPAARRTRFMWTTGLECSYPTVQGGRRRDEYESTRHYERWREDFALCRSLGVDFVRYGLPYYRTHLGPGRYDFEFSDEVLPALWAEGLIPIADLVHFGAPDWVGGFQNRDWPPLFAEYCSTFARRYPWIRFYTPVNEMLVCARMSALEGAWNEQERSEDAMLRAHANMCRASLLAFEAILAVRPDAVFVQSEIAEVFAPMSRQVRPEADWRNQMRFLTFDHLYGRPLASDVQARLRDAGIGEAELEEFRRRGAGMAERCVLGMDYYGMNEKTVEIDGSVRGLGQMLGWHAIALDYYRRYRRPLMLTETNQVDRGHGEAETWLRQTWAQALHLRAMGVPVIGYTWYSLTDQIDWDIQLREIRGVENANGLCRLDRTLRPVGHLFGDLVRSNPDALVPGLPDALVDRGAAEI